jgi:hypothetical protein
MNLSNVKMPVLMHRAALAVTVAGALAGTSCNLFPPPDPGPGAPPFAPNGPHPYGYKGTQSPNYQEPRGGQKEIKRDPNNENVNLEPPPPKNNSSKPPEPENTSKPETPSSPPPSTPPSTPQVKPVEDIPFGINVVGKKGVVYSPYADDKEVDVAGLKRGTKVKCPYTGKTFRVP